MNHGHGDEGCIYGRRSLDTSMHHTAEESPQMQMQLQGQSTSDIDLALGAGMVFTLFSCHIDSKTIRGGKDALNKSGHVSYCGELDSL